ncbi:integrase [Enterobacter genomosp. O]|nr:integrase [Enterobacter genomosp. O]
MGHESAQMVYEVYGAWIEEMNGEQVLMLNDKLAR